MTPFVTQFGDSTSGIGALGVNFQAYVIQLLTFLVVLLVLRKWAFKPILKALKDRRDLIENGVTLGEKMRAQEEAAEAAVASKLQDARKQADAILADAEQDAKQAIAAAEEAAQKRAGSILQEAQDQIKQAVSRERTRLEKEVVGLVSEVSEAVIREKVDAKKDAGLIEKALKERSAA